MKLISAVLLPVIVALGLAWYSLWLNAYAVTPDASGLACALDHFAATGELLQEPLYSVGFDTCWTATKYPVLQFVHQILFWLIPTTSWQLVMATTVFAYIACVAGMSVLTWLMTRSKLAAIIAGVFAAACPALLRSVMLTPQNVFGYLGIIIIMIIVWQMVTTRRWWWVISSVGVLMALAFTHDLSFAIGGISFIVWFVFVYAKQWWSRLLPIGLIGVIFLLDALAVQLPLSPLRFLNTFLNNDVSGAGHPLWDHPAIWGYVITALAAIGLAAQWWKPRTKSYSIRLTFLWLLIIISVVAITLGHVAWLGIGLLPNRFIPFAWLGLVPLASVGMLALQNQLRCPRIMMVALVSLALITQVVHAVIFIQDDTNGWSARYRPEPGYVEALDWLNVHHPRGSLLGVQGPTYQEIILANVWYKGKVYFYPWFNLDHRNLFNFSAPSSTSPLSATMADPQSANYQQLHDFYLIATQPRSSEGLAAITRRHIGYFFTWKRSSEYQQVWSEIPSATFPIIYQNESYVIYDLKP